MLQKFKTQQPSILLARLKVHGSCEVPCGAGEILLLFVGLPD